MIAGKNGKDGDCADAFALSGKQALLILNYNYFRRHGIALGYAVPLLYIIGTCSLWLKTPAGIGLRRKAGRRYETESIFAP